MPDTPPRTVFVTGGTGFIGRHLVARLVSEGHSVRCLVRSPERAALLPPGVEPVFGDVCDRPALRAGMQSAEWVLHLGNLYTMWHPEPGEFWRVNVEGTRAVMESALHAGVSRVVHVSSVAVFGTPNDRPFDERSAPGPRLHSTYARSKAAGDRLVWDLHAQAGLPVTGIYPGIVLGPGDDKPSGRYIQDLIHRRVPSAIFIRARSTYVPVRDVVAAILLAASQPKAVGQRYLIGNERYTGLEWVGMVSEVSGIPAPPLRLPDPLVMAVSYALTGLSRLTHRPPWWGFSIDASRTLQAGFEFTGAKAGRELGLRYTPVRAALAEAVEWYRQREQADRRLLAAAEPAARSPD